MSFLLCLCAVMCHCMMIVKVCACVHVCKHVHICACLRICSHVCWYRFFTHPLMCSIGTDLHTSSAISVVDAAQFCSPVSLATFEVEVLLAFVGVRPSMPAPVDHTSYVSLFAGRRNPAVLQRCVQCGHSRRIVCVKDPYSGVWQSNIPEEEEQEQEEEQEEGPKDAGEVQEKSEQPS